jgi:hypothetical protein
VEDLLLVDSVDGGGDCVEDGGGGLRGWDLLAEFCGECGTGDKFEDEGEPVRSFFNAIESSEVWVLHACGDMHFCEPATSIFVEECGLSGQEFEGDVSVCREFKREPDDGGGTDSEGFEELAVGEDLVGRGFGWSLEEELGREVLAALGGIELQMELAVAAEFDVVFE